MRSGTPVTQRREAQPSPPLVTTSVALARRHFFGAAIDKPRVPSAVSLRDPCQFKRAPWDFKISRGRSDYGPVKIRFRTGEKYASCLSPLRLRQARRSTLVT